MEDESNFIETTKDWATGQLASLDQLHLPDDGVVVLNKLADITEGRIIGSVTELVLTYKTKLKNFLSGHGSSECLNYNIDEDKTIDANNRS